jgi:hypothetical protein
MVLKMKYLIIALSLLCSPAYAQDKPRTVDMTTILHDDAGKPIDDQFTKSEGDKDCSHCKPLTLGNAVAHALFFVGGDEKDVTPEQKWSWATFADKVRNEKQAALTAAEADLVVKRLGKMYGGIVLMRAIPLIDPNRKPPEIK